MKQLAAALIFFTRLPLWRVVRVPDACYRRVVAYWSATGWLTAAVTAGEQHGQAGSRCNHQAEAVTDDEH